MDAKKRDVKESLRMVLQKKKKKASCPLKQNKNSQQESRLQTGFFWGFLCFSSLLLPSLSFPCSLFPWKLAGRRRGWSGEVECGPRQVGVSGHAWCSVLWGEPASMCWVNWPRLHSRLLVISGMAKTIGISFLFVIFWKALMSNILPRHHFCFPSPFDVVAWLRDDLKKKWCKATSCQCHSPYAGVALVMNASINELHSTNDRLPTHFPSVSVHTLSTRLSRMGKSQQTAKTSVMLLARRLACYF